MIGAGDGEGVAAGASPSAAIGATVRANRSARLLMLTGLDAMPGALLRLRPLANKNSTCPPVESQPARTSKSLSVPGLLAHAVLADMRDTIDTVFSDATAGKRRMRWIKLTRRAVALVALGLPFAGCDSSGGVTAAVPAAPRPDRSAENERSSTSSS